MARWRVGKAGARLACPAGIEPATLSVEVSDPENSSENDYAPAFSQISEVLPNNLVVCFDDATAGKNTYEDLKLAVTRDTANVQIKGVQSILERDVFSRVFVLSNSYRQFVLPADDRRFYVTEYPPKRYP